MANTKIMTAVTTHNNLRVRAEPSVLSNSIGVITAKGTTVEIVDTSIKTWYKIKYKDGYGYIARSYTTNFKSKTSSNDENDETRKTTISVTELKKMGYTSIILE